MWLLLDPDDKIKRYFVDRKNRQLFIHIEHWIKGNRYSLRNKWSSPNDKVMRRNAT